MCQFLTSTHPPLHPHPPTTPPLSSILSLYGYSNTNPVTLPLLLEYLSYPMSDLLYSIKYPPPYPNIYSSIRLPQIRILDVPLVLILQNHLINIINGTLPQLLLNQLPIIFFHYFLLHPLLLHFNDITYTGHYQKICGFKGEETDIQPIFCKTLKYTLTVTKNTCHRGSFTGIGKKIVVA